MNQIICESILHMVEQAQFVKGGVAGCCRREYWIEHLQERTGINAGCSKMKQLGQDEAGEAKMDAIRG